MKYIKRRHGVGSNQYMTKRKSKYWGSLAVLAILYLIAQICIFGYQEVDSRVKIAFASESLVTSTNSRSAKLQDSNSKMIQELEAIKAQHPNPTDKEIENYIKTIFGKDSPIAIGVAHHECWTWSNEFPGCVHHSDLEHSVGVFQINLYNKKQNVQADRIPGANMAQKEEWLKNPFNCTLYAYWVHQTSGWFPWSTYQTVLAEFKK